MNFSLSNTYASIKMNRIHVGAYWGPRPESLEQCSARLLVLMRKLREVDPLLSEWRETGYSKKEALKNGVTVTHEGLQGLLSRRRQGRTAALGFSFGLWREGEDKSSCKLKGTCGMSVRAGWNTASILLPFKSPAEDRFKKLPLLKQIVEIAAQAWEPAWVEVATDETVSANLEDVPDGAVEWLPRIGWLTWLPRSRDVIPPLPNGVEMEASWGGGVLIIIHGEKFDSDSSANLQTLKEVRQILLDTRILRHV